MISVVLPTRDRQPLLERALAALLNQSYDQPYEVIVVDDGSRDDTHSYLDALVASSRAQLDVRLVILHHPTSLGKSGARNSGIAASRGDIVAFTDDDMAVDNSWLRELIAPFSTGDVICVYGETTYVSDGRAHYFPERVVANPSARFPMGGNIAYRREVFERVGNFDARFNVYANEDTELALRAVPLGRFVANPRARAHHAPDRWTRETLRKSAINAAVWPLLLRERHREIAHAPFALPLAWRVVYPRDLLALLVSPPLIPFLFVRYLLHGQRDARLFFAKWPLLIVRRRLLIWREAIHQRTFAL